MNPKFAGSSSGLSEINISMTACVLFETDKLDFILFNIIYVYRYGGSLDDSLHKFKLRIRWIFGKHMDIDGSGTEGIEFVFCRILNLVGIVLFSQPWDFGPLICGFCGI